MLGDLLAFEFDPLNEFFHATPSLIRRAGETDAPQTSQLTMTHFPSARRDQFLEVLVKGYNDGCFQVTNEGDHVIRGGFADQVFRKQHFMTALLEIVTNRGRHIFINEKAHAPSLT